MLFRSIDDEPVTIRPRSELVAFNDEHPLPTDTLQGDDATWQAFLALPRRNNEQTASDPVDSTRD